MIVIKVRCHARRPGGTGAVRGQAAGRPAARDRNPEANPQAGLLPAGAIRPGVVPGPAGRSPAGEGIRDLPGHRVPVPGRGDRGDRRAGAVAGAGHQVVPGPGDRVPDPGRQGRRGRPVRGEGDQPQGRGNRPVVFREGAPLRREHPGIVHPARDPRHGSRQARRAAFTTSRPPASMSCRACGPGSRTCRCSPTPGTKEQAAACTSR